MTSKNNKKHINLEEGIASGDAPYRYLRDKGRSLFFNGFINQESITELIMELKYLESVDPNSDINLYINSCGGECAACYSLCDIMNSLKCDIATYGLGEVMSGAAVILSNGTPGKRYIQNHSSVMIHSVQTGEMTNHPLPAARIEWDYMAKLNNIQIDILSKNTGKDKKTLRRDLDRDLYLFGEDAIEYGLADKIF